MIGVNKIYNTDCVQFMDGIEGKSFSLVLTSPPYNVSRTGASDKYNRKYDMFKDLMTNQDYIDWTCEIFNSFDRVLEDNGVVLWNMSYSSENTYLIWQTVAEIIRKTNFVVADTIIWKKKSAIPNNRSSNKLTRICEFVFVFCRKSELKTFNCNKRVVSVIEKTGQKNYENVMNFIEAKNNDGSTELNGATFSSEFASKLLEIYYKSGVVYDCFMGTGTTMVACREKNIDCVGTEISEQQIEYANNRVSKIENKLF